MRNGRTRNVLVSKSDNFPCQSPNTLHPQIMQVKLQIRFWDYILFYPRFPRNWTLRLKITNNAKLVKNNISTKKRRKRLDRKVNTRWYPIASCWVLKWHRQLPDIFICLATSHGRTDYMEKSWLEIILQSEENILLILLIFFLNPNGTLVKVFYKEINTFCSGIASTSPLGSCQKAKPHVLLHPFNWAQKCLEDLDACDSATEAGVGAGRWVMKAGKCERIWETWKDQWKVATIFAKQRFLSEKWQFDIPTFNS